MTRIVVTISIHRPIGVVFDYITTPANWPAWHPASHAVSGSVDHSLLIGEQVTEEFVAGGRHGSCVWQVTRREVPYLWTITTSTPQVQAEITYRLSAQGETIIFERELTCLTSGLWFGGPRFFPDAPAHEPRVPHHARIIEGAARTTRLV